jgi:hypothetical protein
MAPTPAPAHTCIHVHAGGGEGEASWPTASVEAFKKFLTLVLLPRIENGSNANGNWELAMIEGILGIAVVTENSPLFDSGLSLWRSRLPAYFYLHALDGDKPKPFPVRHGEGPPNTQGWYGQIVFNSSVDGLCQESCRDLEHTQMGLASALNAAETARIQVRIADEAKP